MSPPMIFLTFRKLDPKGQPRPRELWIRAREEADRAEKSDALLMLRRGPDAFEQGAGPIEYVVIDVGDVAPTFDEMLAAHLALRCLGGKDAAAYEAFARYAAIARQGLIPTAQPPEVALENIFL